ncbi:uncharacterized protein [Palaemon carinicauda]|uniref:uncharacterized protein n=1 Tax=Palaemon carinicauda TaxID=392227 RepID=UPI0035B68C5F
MAAVIRAGPFNKRCFVITNTLYRHFSVSRINRSPRGVYSERRRNIIVEDEKVVEDLEASHYRLPLNQGEVPVPKTVTKQPSKDSRSIDSMDPVVLKYFDLLEDTRGEFPQEKHYSTNFGMIRFDSDNVPRVHGQFDSINGPDRSAMVDKVMTNEVTTEVSDNETQTQQHSEADVQVNPSSSAPKLRSMSESERVFEELFGGEDEMPSHMSEANGAVKTASKQLDQISHESGKITKTFEAQDAAFIDEQFFGDKVYQHKSNIYDDDAKIGTIPYDNTFHNKDGYHGTLPVIQDVGSTENLNFIDETYFKSSLDTINENRKPPVEFSEIKGELEKSFSEMSSPVSDNLSAHKEDFTKPQSKFSYGQDASSIALRYLGLENETESPLKLYPQEIKEKKKSPPINDPPPKTAYDYVLKKRREIHDSKFGFSEAEAPTSKGYEKILSLVNEKTIRAYTRPEMLSMLKNSVIYDKNDIVGLYKPYGVAMHEGASSAYHILEQYLPELAKHLKAEQLYMIHRLDAKTSGVLILTRTSSMASTLKAMFKEQKIKKTYWAITKGIPKPLQGTIDIPIAEGSIDKKHRMVLRPDLPGFRGSTDKCHRAITEYRVLGKNVNSSWVEVMPVTGVKHQIRVHLGFGLACPVLGDHKYSHLKKLVPQKLPGDMLQRLKLEQSKVRNLPMFLHSRSILIPEIDNGRNIFINAKIPAFFNKTLSALKLNISKNKVRYVGSRCIDEE